MSRDALVVGINTYLTLPSLRAAARDAEMIAQQLHTYGEFRVHRLPEVIQSGTPTIGPKTRLTLRELETALINLFKPKGANVPQTALFYFSGHGIQRDAGIREGFLAVSDTQPDRGFYGLSLFWLRRLLQESPVRQRIVILDCCHSGEFLNFLEADPGAHPGTDRLFMAASREYETAFESLDSPYSVFTQALIDGLDPHRSETGLVTNHTLTGHISQALKGEIQQPLFESSGSEIILTRQTGAPPIAAKGIRSSDVCPYRGLAFFDESHADFFFGREELTARLIQHLKTQPLVAVTGASGIGKSSLVRAGVLPKLKTERTDQGTDRWRIKLMTPGDRPLQSLATAFIDPEASELERAEQLRRAEAFLQDGGRGLAQLVRASLPIAPNPGGGTASDRPRLLLVVDQFEEVFTLSYGAQAEDERQRFFDCLMAASQLAHDCFRLVLVLRTDFLPKCTFYQTLAHQIEQHKFMVTPLKYEQIKATITRPAQKVGLVCEPNLVYTMLLDVSGAPGELPLLQYTLLELWQRRRISREGSVARLTLEAYQELGGVRGTLQKRATDVFNELAVDEQRIAKRIFLALTQLGEGTEDTRRRVMKSELVSPAYPEAKVDRVIEKLVAAKLVVTHQGVDVIHEALIRNWPLLRQWLSENREILRRMRRIEQAAQEWELAGSPRGGDYLLQGLRLRDAEDFLKSHLQELSALTQQFIAVSHEESRRTRRESRQLQVAVPSVLVATLAVVFSQYNSIVQSHAEKDQQLQIATSRERAAVAQAILRDTGADPMAALLVGRLAAEEGGFTYEVQSSLRSALQSLRLQLELRGHEGAIHQIAFSPNQRDFATASADGTIRIWSLHPQTIYNTAIDPLQVLVWTESETLSPTGPLPTGNSPCTSQPCPTTNAGAADITAVQFSPDGTRIAAIANQSPVITIWDLATGEPVLHLTGSAPVTQIQFSPNGEWIATAHSDQTIAIWQAQTGAPLARLAHAGTVHSLQFSADGHRLLSASADRTAQLWQLAPNAPQTAIQTAPQGLKIEKLATLTHPSAVQQAIFSPSGRWIATAGEDGLARLWDPATGQLQATLALASTLAPLSASTLAIPTPAALAGTASPLVQVEFNAAETTLTTIDRQQQIRVWSVESQQLQHSLSSHHRMEASVQTANSNEVPAHLSLSPTQDLLVATDLPEPTQSAARLWNPTTDEVVLLPGHHGSVAAMAFSPDGTYIVTADAAGTVRLWAAELGGELPTLETAQAPVEWAMFLQSPRSSSPQPASPTPVEEATPEPPADSSSGPWHLLTSRPISPDPMTLEADSTTLPLSGEQDLESTIANLVTITPTGHLQRWQIVSDPIPRSEATGRLNARSPEADVPRPSLWQRMMSWLSRYSQELDATPPALALPSQQLIQAPPAQADAPLPEADSPGTIAPVPAALQLVADNTTLSSVAVSPDGQLIAKADLDGWVEVYQVQADQSLTLRYRIRNRRAVDQSSAALSDVVPASEEQTAAETATGGDPVVLRQLLFSPDGHTLLAIADDFTVRVWDVATGRTVQVLQGHRATIQQARFSPNGQWIATASWDRTVRIWQVASGKTVTILTHSDSVNSASFSPDSQTIVTAGWDGTARLFDVGTGDEQLVMTGHRDAVLDAQFSPDGRLLVTASADGTARLWDTETGTEQAELRPDRPGTSEPILQASFSPDGQFVATLTKDGEVELWAATWDMLLQLARSRSLRQLTPEECNRYLKLSTDQCPVLP